MITCKEYTDLKKKELTEYIKEKGLHPCLVVIQVGDRPESNSYIRGKMRDCEEVGIECVVKKYPENISTGALVFNIGRVLRDTKSHGIIVQLPLPEHINVKDVQSWIPERNDVDGFNSDSPFDPCTPKGVIDYLAYIGYEFEGKDALVIGRSDIVGKPLARMLTDLDCTVTLAHSKSGPLWRRIMTSDIVFTAIDKIETFNGAGIPFTNYAPVDFVDIGLGVSDRDGKLHGNLLEHTVWRIKDAYPNNICISGTGGVGLLTRLALLENVVKACETQTPPEFLQKKFNVAEKWDKLDDIQKNTVLTFVENASNKED